MQLIMQLDYQSPNWRRARSGGDENLQPQLAITASGRFSNYLSDETSCFKDRLIVQGFGIVLGHLAFRHFSFKHRRFEVCAHSNQETLALDIIVRVAETSRSVLPSSQWSMNRGSVFIHLDEVNRS